MAEDIVFRNNFVIPYLKQAAKVKGDQTAQNEWSEKHMLMGRKKTAVVFLMGRIEATVYDHSNQHIRIQKLYVIYIRFHS